MQLKHRLIFLILFWSAAVYVSSDLTGQIRYWSHRWL